MKQMKGKDKQSFSSASFLPLNNKFVRFLSESTAACAQGINAHNHRPRKKESGRELNVKFLVIWILWRMHMFLGIKDSCQLYIIGSSRCAFACDFAGIIWIIYIEIRRTRSLSAGWLFQCLTSGCWVVSWAALLLSDTSPEILSRHARDVRQSDTRICNLVAAHVTWRHRRGRRERDREFCWTAFICRSKNAASPEVLGSIGQAADPLSKAGDKEYSEWFSNF